MITISFHFASLIVGLLVGLFGGLCFALLSLFGERWGAGFSDGWKCGKEYAEERMKKDV